MDKKIFAETQRRIERYVGENRLRDAFGLARSLAEGVAGGLMGSKPGQSVAPASVVALKNEIASAEEGYRYMLEYAARGAEDPGRAEMTRRFGMTVLEIVDRLARENQKADSSAYYFSTLRYEDMQNGDSIRSLLDTYARLVADGSMFNMVVSGSHSDKFRMSLIDREALERRLFNRVWVTHPIAGADAEAVKDALASSELPAYFRQLLVSALTLGGLEYFDERRIDLMLDAYDDRDDKVSAAAFIGVMLLLHSGRKRLLSSKLRAKLAAFDERLDWHKDLRTAYMEFTKTVDTDRISRKIRDEVVPEMLKLRPEIDKKLNSKIETLDAAEFEENPEWHDMLEKSGLADKLKEMSEIQEEGGDVMMGTFAHLKSFPFFNEPANWYLPFHTDYSEFTGNESAIMQPVADLMTAAHFLCDSDKFSMMFSLRAVPAAQRDLMLSQLKAQGEQIDQLRAATLFVGNAERRNIFNKQVQNIYRFYKLFRRKGEFPNPFEGGVNLVEVECLKEGIARMEILPLVAEFYFSHGYYDQAANLYGIIMASATPDAPLHQKMGYALEKTGNLAGAVEYYSKAEMLDGHADWTLRRLARCLMALRRPEEALQRLRILEERHPEHAPTALNIGRCLVELERYDEAIGEYYKAEYLDEKSGKALRPLAWCLLLTGDLPQSRKYYEKVIATTTPVAVDYLNMGHLALAEGHFREAMNFYSLNVSARVGDAASSTSRQEAIDAFIADMRADSPALQRAGVDPTLIPLLVDSLLYSI